MMCELPSNALLADEFLDHFDGFSIGSNDLTQLTLGLDRDSASGRGQLRRARPGRASTCSSAAIGPAGRRGKYVGICGQGPSDHPDLADWLLGQASINVAQPRHGRRHLDAASRNQHAGRRRAGPPQLTGCRARRRTRPVLAAR